MAEERLILVADKDLYVRELGTHFLRQAGFLVESCTDGPSALKQSQLRRPVMLITEILLPKIDGLSLCRQIKQDPATRDILVIVISILAAIGRAKEAGADAFLAKPLAENILIDTVNGLLHQHPLASCREDL